MRMPTFDFQCTKCQKVFEFNRPFGSSVSPKCPECGSKKTEKLLSPPAIVFKGDGWYKTHGRKQETKGTEATEGTKEKMPKDTKAPEKKAESKKD